MTDLDQRGLGADEWTVDDSLAAREILHYLGVGSDPSLEPYADRRRDNVAQIIRRRVCSALSTPAVKTTVEPAGDGGDEVAWAEHGKESAGLYAAVEAEMLDAIDLAEVRASLLKIQRWLGTMRTDITVLSAYDDVCAALEKLGGRKMSVTDEMVERACMAYIGHRLDRERGPHECNSGDMRAALEAAFVRQGGGAGEPPAPPEDAAISVQDPMLILAGIKQFGLAADGSDIRDLASAIAALRAELATARLEGREAAAREAGKLTKAMNRLRAIR